MRLLFWLFLSLRFENAVAQLCASSREFGVDNCTACPTLDRTGPVNIPMAVCKGRAAEPTGGNTTTYTCVCGNFPASTLISAVRYYPQIDGNNVTQCAPSWATAPKVYTAFAIVSAAVILYAAAYCFYITLLSRICCCHGYHSCSVMAPPTPTFPHSLTHSLTHSSSPSLTHSLNPSFTHPPTHSLTHRQRPGVLPL